MLYKMQQGQVIDTRTISPTPPAIEISTPGKSSWDPPPAPLLPLNGLCLGERCHNPSSASGVSPPPLRGSRSCSSLTPAHDVWFSPLPSTSFALRLGFARSAFRSLRSRSAVSFPSPLRSTFRSRLCGPVGEHFGW